MSRSDMEPLPCSKWTGRRRVSPLSVFRSGLDDSCTVCCHPDRADGRSAGPSRPRRAGPYYPRRGGRKDTAPMGDRRGFLILAVRAARHKRFRLFKVGHFKGGMIRIALSCPNRIRPISSPARSYPVYSYRSRMRHAARAIGSLDRP